MTGQGGAHDDARPSLVMRDVARRFTLRFRDPALESRFREAYRQRSLGQVRISLLLGAFLYAIFGILDTFIIPELASSARFLRYVVICPAVLLAWAVTFTATGRRHLVAVQAIVSVVAGAGVLWFATRRGALAPLLYASGVPLVNVYAFTFMRLPFLVASATMVPTAVVSIVILAAMGHLALPVLVNQGFFTASFLVAGMSAGYAIEWHERALFLQRQELAERSAELRSALDNVHVLSGLLPMCAWCRKVRDDRGYWDRVETFLARHTGAEVSHSICPDCAARLAQEVGDDGPERVA